MADGSKFAQLMTKKGPMDLPMGVWVIVGGGGLFFAYRTYKKAGSATPSVATTGTTGNGVDALGGGTYTPVGGNITTSDTGSSSTGNSFADNNAWATAAINYLVGLGNDPGIANQAITLYLASQPLTTSQMQAMVNVAIQHLGAPPLTVAPVNGTVTPIGGSSGTTDETHVFGSGGRDLGPWKYGQDQITYITQHIGSYGYTQQILNDVQAAYNKVVAKDGAAYANQMHYNWIGPGNVTATQQFPIGSQPIKVL